MEIFSQGTRLGEDDLVTVFWAYPVYYPTIYGNYYSPYWVRYGIGYTEDGHYHEFGARYRIPVEIKTGYFRPNFIVGEDWAVGKYEIRWKYKNYENSEIEYRSVEFEVCSSGINNQKDVPEDYLDLPAQMFVYP